MTRQRSNIPDFIYDKLDEANRFRLGDRVEDALGIYLNLTEWFTPDVKLLTLIAHLYFIIALRNANETGENYTRAIHYLEEAILLKPDDAFLYAQLAEIYNLGTLNYALAAQHYRRSLEINPHSVSTLWSAASLYGVPEKVVSLDETIRWLEYAIELNSGNPHFHIRLGDLYQEAGRAEAAQTEWGISLFCFEPLETETIESIKNRFKSLAQFQKRTVGSNQ